MFTLLLKEFPKVKAAGFSRKIVNINFYCPLRHAWILGIEILWIEYLKIFEKLPKYSHVWLEVFGLYLSSAAGRHIFVTY